MKSPQRPSHPLPRNLWLLKSGEQCGLHGAGPGERRSPQLSRLEGRPWDSPAELLGLCRLPYASTWGSCGFWEAAGWDWLSAEAVCAQSSKQHRQLLGGQQGNHQPLASMWPSPGIWTQERPFLAQQEPSILPIELHRVLLAVDISPTLRKSPRHRVLVVLWAVC